MQADTAAPASILVWTVTHCLTCLVCTEPPAHGRNNEHTCSLHCIVLKRLCAELSILFVRVHAYVCVRVCDRQACYLPAWCY